MSGPLRPIGFIEPCLPSSAAKPPSGPGWIHEIERDGFRFPAPLTAERDQHTCFIVKNHTGMAVPYVYFEDEPAGDTCAQAR